MIRLLLVAACTLLLAAPPAAAQQFRAVSGAEGAVLGSLSNVTSWLGTLAGERGGAVVVGVVLMSVPEIDIRSGDVVRRMNGAAVQGLAGLVRAYDALAVGAPVKLEMQRAGKPVTLEFRKPHPSRVPRLTVETQTLDGGRGNRQ